MNDMNNEVLEGVDTAGMDEASISNSSKAIEDCKDMIVEAVNSGNDERLKGILQACMVGLGVGEDELNDLVDTTKRGINGELTEDEIKEVSGGNGVFTAISKAASTVGGAIVGHKKAILIGLGAAAAVAGAGVGATVLIKNKKKAN